MHRLRSITQIDRFLCALSVALVACPLAKDLDVRSSTTAPALELLAAPWCPGVCARAAWPALPSGYLAARNAASFALPLVEREGRWVADRSVACPVLVPLLSLGRRVIASEGSGDRAGSFEITAAEHAVGGPALRTMCLTEELFAAAAMRVGDKDLMAMKVTELKEELEARDEAKSGNKA